MINTDTKPVNTNSSANRDALTLRMLGWFFAILAGLVLIATFWTLGDFRATVVNVSSGLVLGIIGVALILASRRMGEREDE